MSQFGKKIVILLLSICFFSGCWNYRETEKMTIVAGMALDKDPKTKQYIVTVELVIPAASKEQSQMGSRLIQTKGDTIFDAVRDFIMKTGRKLYWAHTKILVISEKVAREGVVPVMDWVNRGVELRTGIWLLVSREKTAREVLITKTKIDNIVSFQLSNIIESQPPVSKFEQKDLWEAMNELSAEAMSLTLPTAKKLTNVKGEKVPAVYGTAIFNKDKMIGWLNGEESKLFLIIRDKLKGGIIVVEDKKQKKSGVASLEIFKNKTKIQPVYEKGKLTMDIEVKTDVGIAELDTTQDLIEKQGRKRLKKKAEAEMKKDIEDFIEKVQKQYKTDIFGFGGIIEREMPKVWKTIQPRWGSIFQSLKIKVHTEIDFANGSGTSSKPIKVRR